MLKILSKSVIIMFIFDVLVFSLSSLLCCQIYDIGGLSLFIIIGLTVLAGIIVLFLKSNYKIREFNINGKNVYLLFEGIVLAHIPIALIMFCFLPYKQTILFLITNIVIIFASLEIYRFLFHFYLFKLKPVKNILIIGSDKNAKLIADEIINKKALKMTVVGYVENDGVESDLNILSNPENILGVIKEKDIDIIIMADDTVMKKIPAGIPAYIKVYGFYDIYEMITGKFFLDDINVERFCYDFLKNESFVYDVCQRIFDIISALIILTVTAPVLAYICIRIKLTDGGSPIYTQTRVTKGGKKFEVYKLRTMYLNDFVPNNSDSIALNADQEEDNRIIPFCRFVRKARLDEIPQMINILKGEMSIVGPRAEWEVYSEIWEKEVPYFTTRYVVKSAWTGYGHISCGHTDTYEDETERLQYDLYFIKHRNILWEIGILIKAVFLVLGKRNRN